MDQTEQHAELDRDLIKRTVGHDLTDDELDLFLYQCRRYGLDPLLGQIHATKRKQRQDDGSYTARMVIQVGIDGYRAMAQRTGRYCPGPITYHEDKDGRFYAATATVYVLVPSGHGTKEWRPVEATAYLREYMQTRWDAKAGQHVPNAMWAKMPRNQTAKCAEALALRRALPDLGGLYTDEEMEQADSELVEPMPAPGAHLHPAVKAAVREQREAIKASLGDKPPAPEPTAPEPTRAPEKPRPEPEPRPAAPSPAQADGGLTDSDLAPPDPPTDEQRKRLKALIRTKVEGKPLLQPGEVAEVVEYLSSHIDRLSYQVKLEALEARLVEAEEAAGKPMRTRKPGDDDLPI